MSFDRKTFLSESQTIDAGDYKLKTYQFFCAAFIAFFLAMPGHSVLAHAFGDRYDLPIPLNYFLFAGGITVALSFIFIGILVKDKTGRSRNNFKYQTIDYPRFNILSSSAGTFLLKGRFLTTAVKLISVSIFALTIATSLFGTERPIENFAPTFIWIIWWVGMGLITALIGNLWTVVNPWSIIFDSIEMVYIRFTKNKITPIVKYPANWDVWPAVIGFLLFAWVENVYTGAILPSHLGRIIVAYSIFTWVSMLLFGKHTWLSRGELFSVIFGFLARFSPTEIRVINNKFCKGCEQECNFSDQKCVDCLNCYQMSDNTDKELNIRPYAIGLIPLEKISSAKAVLVILLLAMVSFDGIQETPLWISIQSNLISIFPYLGTTTINLIDTLSIALVPLLFFCIYIVFTMGIKILSKDQDSVLLMSCCFVFSLIPIAIAYHIAHYLSYLLVQGQLIIPLILDPFGLGWDYWFSDYSIRIGVINAKISWFLSVALIILGHVISVYLAHIISLRRVYDIAAARKGQYPMLILMVFYTATSLWIMAQPIVEQ